jgi:hypothetical protein
MSTTFYTTDGMGVFAGAVQVSPFDPLPPGTLTPPPDTTGTEVAQLQGTQWVVLPEYPAPPVPPPPTPEQLREIAKAARAVAVENILVTTQAGNTFDGDETSQTRMSRAILVLSTGAAATVPWVLADNTVIQADIAELTEALALAGAEQARLWVL